MKLRKLVTMREALEGDGYFGRLLEGDSWAAWRVLLIAIVGERLTKRERVVFKGLTGRDSEPGEPVEEFWGVIGRRGGKTRAMSVLASYLAACVDHRTILAPGERGVIPLLAMSVQRAASAFAFVEGIFAVAPNLKDLVDGATSDTLSLTTGVDIQVRPASFRTIRGITAIAAIADELAFWRSDDSANPDKEILQALRPSLATTGGPLICISSPHAKRGELYTTFKRHWGPAGDPLMLVAKAASRVMNPSLSQRVVDRAVEADPEAASAEYGAEFRGDLEIFVSREAMEACVATGVTVRSPLPGVTYRAFVDPSGGSNDAMTCAIGHLEGERVVLDCILERRAPFSPDSVDSEFAETLRQYGIARVTGDRYAGEWPVERFSVAGIAYEPAAPYRTDLYLGFLPLLNSGRVDLLDNPRMVSQFCALERRTSRAGKDSVDHPRDAHDDIANSVAGLLVALDSDRRLPLVRQSDLLDLSGAPYPTPVAGGIGAVLIVRDGIAAVVYAAFGIPYPGSLAVPTPDMFVLDFDRSPMHARTFADISARLEGLRVQCRAKAAWLHVAGDMPRHNLPPELDVHEIPKEFEAEGRSHNVSLHTSARRVGICSEAHQKQRRSPFAGALDFRAGEDADDPPRAAGILLVALGLDSTGGRAAA